MTVQAPAALELILKPSARAHHLLFWIHILPLVLLPLTMQTGVLMLTIAAGIAGSWIWVRRHPAFGYGPMAIRRILAQADHRWTIETSAPKPVAAELLSSSYVHPRVLVLNFRVASGQKRSRVLLGDEVSPELLRKLRARLITDAGKSLEKDG